MALGCIIQLGQPQDTQEAETIDNNIIYHALFIVLEMKGFPPPTLNSSLF